jgi:transposase InsO family protein
MPWKEKSTMSLRLEFVRLASLPDANISQLADRFAISRKTAYKWLRRFHNNQDLADRSRKPLSSPKRTADDLEALILKTRDEHPAWGGRKIRVVLQNAKRTPLPSSSTIIPSPSTITAILRRHNRLDGPRVGQPRNWQRFERPNPNDLWQMDFKGHVGMTNGQRCHPLTVLDDHSRYALGLIACADECHATVQTALTDLFRRHGLPVRMLMDNGSPWGDNADNPYTIFTVWLLRLGIGVSHGRPYHPQTQGKDERFHRTFKSELLSRYTLSDLDDSQRRFDSWRDIYNHHRPHESLHMKPPATRYRPSPRTMPETLPPIEYHASDCVRKVQNAGRVHYRGQTYHLSKAFAGQPIALRPTARDGEIAVWFCSHQLGYLDVEHGLFRRLRSGPDSTTENSGESCHQETLVG